jgi:small subunit ribosomal protein S16
VAVKIKLKRLGKIRAPYYRIVVADARTKRDGRAIEEIGKYHPKAEPSFIEVNSERAQHWLSVGAQPTDPVRKILEITGDWQTFKGLPGTEGTLRTAAPKQDRKEIFAAAVSETLSDGGAAPKGRAKAKSGDAAAKDADSAGGKAGKAAAGQAKADKPARGKAAEPAKGKDARAADAAEGDGSAKASADDEAATAKTAKAAAAPAAAETRPASAEGKPAETEPASAEGKPAETETKAAAAEPEAEQATAPESGA